MVSPQSSTESQKSGRARLIEATSQLMRERETLDIPLSEISAKAEMNAALVKYYFGSKEGLLHALLERDVEASLEQLEHLLAMPITAGRKLRYHLAGMISTYHTYPYLNRLIIKLMRESDEAVAQSVADRFLKPIARAYEAILEQGVASGELRSFDPELLYFNIIGVCDHLFSGSVSLRYCFGKSGVDDDMRRRYTDQVIELFMNGILA